MEVLNPRAALLSNHEVLTLLRELDSEHVAQLKTAHRIKKEESDAQALGATTHVPTNIHGTLLEVPENLRTLEVEAIQYLSSDYLPTSQQTPDGITRLAKGLAPFGLTKAEKLQVVNLAPTLPVELYVIMEELEDRIGDKMDEVLTLVQSSLNTPVATAANGQVESHEPAVHQQIIAEPIDDENDWTTFDDIDAIGEEEQYDDTGEGTGIEGDLEMNED
ncbi:hypothetical protein M378DRAFT_196791 [Amanita muscaria Koide BX008]|uniref:DNA-directed RNA polymerase III subunit RPC9 n=1 Tax=Amanita muscaria (strain Koide BX008) TaxID=946122 RepID=A0A0C2TL01_AMAMK|nr:hypothetical protein M378DRAFT_196791 [Amanita muscaria Koide BX008]